MCLSVGQKCEAKGRFTGNEGWKSVLINRLVVYWKHNLNVTVKFSKSKRKLALGLELVGYKKKHTSIMSAPTDMIV